MPPSAACVPVRPPTAAAPALRAAWTVLRQEAESCGADPLVAAQARGVLAAYDARWRGVAGEFRPDPPPVPRPIVNPASGRSSRTFCFAAACDGVAVLPGQLAMLAIRTASEVIDAEEAPFWQRMALDDRPGMAALALEAVGLDVGGVLHDVIRRPAIQARLIPKGKEPREEGTLLEILVRGTYHGRKLTESQREAALAGEARETPDLLALRVESDARARPDRYFQRRAVPLGDCRDRAARELWRAAAAIRRVRLTGEHLRNPDACLRFGRLCPYHAFCTGACGPHSPRYRRRERLHPELGGGWTGTADPGVLTPARVQCFRTCRMKHYLRYELGIEPVEDDSGESLRFGRLIRAAVAAWWRQPHTERGPACPANAEDRGGPQ